MSRPLCTDDVVALRSASGVLAVVERTHGDVDTHDPHPGRSEGVTIKCDGAIDRRASRKFMKDGIPPKNTVLIRWNNVDELYLLPESQLDCVDRSFLIGDVVKRNSQDAMSGIVINTFSKCTLQPMCDMKFIENDHNSAMAKLKGLLPPKGAKSSLRQSSIHRPGPILDVPASELKYADSPTPEDLVIYGDWIGRVEEITTMIALKLSDNSVVEISDDDADQLDDAADHFGVGDIAVTKKGVLRKGNWIYGKYNPNTMALGTVVRIRILTAEVDWLETRIGGSDEEPPSLLERKELESDRFCIYDRTRRPPGFQATHESSNISNSDIDVRINLRVRFKDFSGACVKYDGSNGHGKIERIDRKDSLGYDLNVFDVVRFETDVLIQWQDLTISRDRSVDLLPDVGIDDEHDAWPGEIAHPVDLEPVIDMPDIQQASKVGIIQSVNASERMAKVRWCPDACVQYTNIESIRSSVLGVVGTASGQDEELSLYELEAPGELNVRRGDIVLVARPLEDTAQGGRLRDRDWLGEVVGTRLDGLLTVRLGAAEPVRDINLRREDIVVAIRSDGTDDIMDWDEESFTGVRFDSDGEEISDSDDSASEDMDDYDSLDYSAGSMSDLAEATYEDENGAPLDESDVENEDWESDKDTDVEMADAPEETPVTSQSETPPPSMPKQDVAPGADNLLAVINGAPESYLVLSSLVPASHAFSARAYTQSSNHIKRATKEHRILSTPSNLPSGVYVRTWESRLDLLRVLFLGPADTPYADAPFVIDFFLPSSFPTDPPEAFFHSWKVESGLGGVGRVNPNLYEDGKICLSLLGTWESGGKGSSEGWSASRSTLLQVIVSILGLVLVREPYFNEAGYEPLAGLESSKRASQLYSESAFLKARTFIIAALRQTDGSSWAYPGLEGLEDALKWLYRSLEGPRLLEKSVSDAEALLRRSEDGESVGVDSQLTMSKGACIPLRKILERLKGL